MGGGGGGGKGLEKKGVEGGMKPSLPQNGFSQFPPQQPHLPPQSQSGASRNGIVPALPEGASPYHQYAVPSHGYINFSPSPAYQQTPPSHHADYNYSTANSQPPLYSQPPQNHMASISGASSSSSEFPVFSPSVQSGVPSTPNYSYTPLTHSSPNSSSESSTSNSHLTPSSPFTSTETSSSVSSDVLLPNILHFSFSELSAATSGFTVGLVGMGSFGSVYKAVVRGTGPYAVKKLHNVRFKG